MIFFFKKTLIDQRTITERLVTLGIYIALLITAHTLLISCFENIDYFDSFWLTLTTILTVGYGDIAAKTVEGRWTTIILMYAGGVFALANFAATWLEFRQDRVLKQLRGLWRWKVKDHIVILNSPDDVDVEHFFLNLVQTIRSVKEFAPMPIVLVTRAFNDNFPESLVELNCVQIHAKGYYNKSLRAANVADAKYVLVLSKSTTDPMADAATLDIVMRLVEENGDPAHIVAEVVDKLNRPRITKCGADAVVRPIRAFPQLIVGAMKDPNMDQALDEFVQTKLI